MGKRKIFYIVCGRVPWLYQYWPGGIMIFCGSLSRNSRRLSRSIFFVWPCSLAVPVLAGWYYVFCGSLSRNSRRLNRSIFLCGRVPWLCHYWPGGFVVFVVLCPGTHKGSTGSGSGFKASQKTGQWFNVSSDRQIYYPQLVWEPVIGLIK